MSLHLKYLYNLQDIQIKVIDQNMYKKIGNYSNIGANQRALSL